MEPGQALAVGLVAGAAAAAIVAGVLARRAKRRALDSERRARDAEHLAYIGTLAGGLAHEIRNPLSTLSLNVQLLHEDLERPGHPMEPRLARRFETLEQEAGRLQQILDDFLNLAGKHEVRLVAQPLNTILEDVLGFYADRLQRSGIQVRTNLAEGLPPVKMDRDRLKQALANLILNAEAAMTDGGDLMIATEGQRRGVRLHITDTGSGIAWEDLDRIFQPYYSTRAGGTGLGLPTVKRIVTEHKGALEVHSEVGRGTRFTIDLPAAEEAN